MHLYLHHATATRFGSGLIEEVSCTWCVAGKYQTGSGYISCFHGIDSFFSVLNELDACSESLKPTSGRVKGVVITIQCMCGARVPTGAALAPDWFFEKDIFKQQHRLYIYIEWRSPVWD